VHKQESGGEKGVPLLMREKIESKDAGFSINAHVKCSEEEAEERDGEEEDAKTS